MKNIIKKIEKILNIYSKKYWIDLLYFTKNGFRLLIVQFVNSLRGIILILLLTNLLGKERFWEYTFIMAIIWIMSIFALPGSGIAIIQSISRWFEWTYKFLLKNIFSYSTIGSWVLVLIWIFINYFKEFPNANVFFWIALLFPIYVIAWYYPYFLTGEKKFDLRAKYETITSILMIFWTVISLLLFRDIIWIVPSILVVKILANSIFEIKVLKSANKKIDQEAFQYAKKLSRLNVFTMIKMYWDKLIVSYYLWLVQTWVYAIATNINDQIYALWKIIGNLFMPKTANIPQEELSKRKNKMIIVVGWFFLILSFILILLYPTLIPLLLWEWFKDAIIYTQTLTAFVTIKCIFIVMNLVDQSKKDLKTTVFSNTVSPIIEITLMIIWWYYFQIFGIIGAKIIGDTMNLLYLLLTKNHKRQSE